MRRRDQGGGDLRHRCDPARKGRPARTLDNQYRRSYLAATFHTDPMQCIEDLHPWVLCKHGGHSGIITSYLSYRGPYFGCLISCWVLR